MFHLGLKLLTFEGINFLPGCYNDSGLLGLKLLAPILAGTGFSFSNCYSFANSIVSAVSVKSGFVYLNVAHDFCSKLHQVQVVLI